MNRKQATIGALRNIPIPDGDEEGPGGVERLQFRWLNAISATSDEPAAKWLGELTSKYGSPPKHPDYLSYIETRWGPGPSPYSAEELVAPLPDDFLMRRELVVFDWLVRRDLMTCCGAVRDHIQSGEDEQRCD